MRGREDGGGLLEEGEEREAEEREVGEKSGREGGGRKEESDMVTEEALDTSGTVNPRW